MEAIEKLAAQIDEKIKSVNEIAIAESQKYADGKLAEQSESYKAAQAELSDKLNKYADELAKIKAEQEKAGNFNFGSDADLFNKAMKGKEDMIKSLINKDATKSASIEVSNRFLNKSEVTMTTGNALSDRRVIPFDRVIQNPVFDPEERPLRDYFNFGTTTRDSVEWPIEESYTNGAGPVNSDAAAVKADSSLEWDLQTLPVRDIAHYVRLHKNLMNDLPLLQSYLPNRLRDGLLREESRQILLGTNANLELIGINGTNQAFDDAAFQAAIVQSGKALVDANFIDILGYAITQLRKSNYAVDRILISPEDMYTLMFSVNADGTYHMNTPLYQYVMQYVAQSNYVAAGSFYVANLRRASTIFARENVGVEFSYEDRDNFVKNLVTIRGEMREVLVTERPNGIVFGNFADAVDDSEE